MMTVIVASAIANKPCNGGNAWAVLNWVLGLQALGCTVIFCEQIDSRACTDENGQTAPFAESINRAFFRDVMERFQLTGSSALICDGGAQIEGLSYDDVLHVARAADV